MRALIVTDTHLGIKKSNVKYLEIVKTLFTQICQYAVDNNIDILIHLGDFFDNRKHLSLTALDYATEIGSMVNTTFSDSYFILGNHDLFYKDRYFPTSHQVFNEYSNIHVISEPTVIDNILMVPWQLENDRYHPYANLNDYKTRFCMGHFDINGSKMGLNTKDASGCRFKVSDFSQFEMTLSGHFHTIGNYPNNVKFIGAPYHQTFADSGNRGFYLWDNGNIVLIHFTDYPEYVSLEAKDDLYDKEQIEGKVVRLTFYQDYGNTKNGEIIKYVADLKPLQLFTKYQFDSASTDKVLDDDIKLNGVKEIHKDYIEKDNIPEHLNKALILKIVDQLYEEYNNK